jgi:hypothetical protein
MKTTLNLNDDLLVKAKAIAAREKTTLTSLIEEGLKLRLRKARPNGIGKMPVLQIYRGKGGLVDGIDPLSNRSLYDAADDTGR